MTIAIISILLIVSVIWFVNKKLSIKICPICAGVSLTWLWMLLGMGYGLLSVEKYQLVTAVLMGGSVVGITNKLEEKYKILKRRKIVNRNNGKAEILKEQLDDCC
ncbi:hypothetical protein A3A95_02190 [Candidatus Nomurabacteria bacterium RIFCSPLOWO2_01_FULL_39_18]|uniref:Uncharacterized protein n=1 Tax=Candidatus Nomurabacteria bacterium RIFCSPHIGHO2_01_FULL_40_24b TaxID=1801739 RepID=A0A1F6V9A1_9BACT|nr:MAG: hypothetical protein A2647_00525 [Candidatus Nomurabacteria bacterium RIFCSPHIGHO2_01_FULL_40_24b]OGI90672.1 MAG: hypothetical protein A3A95_02190 [Candidatus Nomurabacteria bacterium RIFCSPLOWO2_01_FULL_39_18]